MKKMLFIIALSIFTSVYFSNNSFGEDLERFLNEAIPQLLLIPEEIPEVQKAFEKTGEKPLDTLTFAYRFAVRKIEFETGRGMDFGIWNNNIKEDVKVCLSLLCAVKDFLHIRKERGYQDEMTKLRPVLTRGSYMQMIRELMLTEQAYKMTLRRLQYGPRLTNIQEILNPTGIELIKDTN
jgi:hypothetical protein